MKSLIRYLGLLLAGSYLALEFLPEKIFYGYPLLSATLIAVGAIGGLIILGVLIYFWGCTKFKTRAWKVSWFIILIFGSSFYALGPILFYVVVFELGKTVVTIPMTLSQPSKQSRFVHLIGYLSIFYGFLSLVTVFFVKDVGAMLPQHYYYIIPILSIFFGVVGIILGIALIKRKVWARKYFLIFTVLEIIVSSSFYFVYHLQFTIPFYLNQGKKQIALTFSISQVILIIWLFIVIWVLNRSFVKREFQR